MVVQAPLRLRAGGARAAGVSSSAAGAGASAPAVRGGDGPLRGAGVSGQSSGGQDAATSPGASFAGLVGVTAPLTGLGTGGAPLAIPAATSSVPGYMTAAQAAQLAGLNIAQDLRSTLVAEALVDLGLTATPNKLMFWMHEHFAHGVNGLFANGAVVTLSSGTSQGLRASAGATIQKRYYGSGDAAGTGLVRMFINGAAKRFWMALSLMPETAPAGCQVGISLFSSTGVQQLFLGVAPSVSATNWVATGTAGVTPLDSGVAFNNAAFGIAKVYRDGTNSFIKVGAAAAVSGSVRPNLDSTPCPVELTGGSAGAAVGQWRWAAFAAEVDT